MTEIPEHLLKRAKERRAAMGGGASASADTPAASAPADAAPAAASAPTPAKAKPPAPLPTLSGGEVKAVPDIAVVAAAKRRKRVPFWAASVLVLLPVWGFIYYNAVKPAGQGPTDPMALGAEVYSGAAGCAGCHTPDGAGSAAGAQLNEGHTIETFVDPLRMVHWIGYGSDGASNEDDTYGDANRPPIGRMPDFKDSLTPEEIAAVTIYIRNNFGGDLYDPENEQGFTAEGFEADPEGIIAEAEAALALGEGVPDVSEIPRADG